MVCDGNASCLIKGRKCLSRWALAKPNAPAIKHPAQRRQKQGVGKKSPNRPDWLVGVVGFEPTTD